MDLVVNLESNFLFYGLSFFLGCIFAFGANDYFCIKRHWYFLLLASPIFWGIMVVQFSSGSWAWGSVVAAFDVRNIPSEFPYDRRIIIGPFMFFCIYFFYFTQGLLLFAAKLKEDRL